MSLGDELRYLRAMRGGPSYNDIQERLGLPQGTLWWLERKYCLVGEDDEVLERLAAYYHTTLENLQFHRKRYRKALSVYLDQAKKSGQEVNVLLRTGEWLRGRVLWWDLAAFGLQTEEWGPTVVQRHAVIDWEGADEE